MIRSMTGFGRSQEVIDGYSVSFEIKSVNHRYFEFYSRVPRQFGFLEEKLKSFVKDRVSRGKIECYLSIEELEAEDAQVLVNKSLAAGYVNALSKISDDFGLKNDITAMQIARFPEVLSVHKEESDEEKIWNVVKTVADSAVDKFVKMRETEGARLKEDIAGRAEAILECVSFVEQRSPQTVKEYNDRLLARMKEILDERNIDESRILTEAAIYADKVAVAEETVRLRSHISQLVEFLKSDEAVGRKMDFLVQEINRETNTIGSKCQDVEITKRVLTMKNEIEKIREQIQNIE